MKQRANLRSPLFLQYASRPAEVEAENYITYSEEFDNAVWSKSNTSVTANQIDSPDGATTADKVTHSGSTSSNYVFRSGVPVTSGQTYTFSVFAKSGMLSYLQLIPTTTQFGSTHQNYDLDNGVLGSSSGDITSNIENYGNGWYRCSISLKCTTSGTGGILVSLARSSNENRLASFSSDGHIYLWGAQAEDNSLTSYIKTEGTTVTRAATTAAQEEDVTAELRIYNGGGGYDYERTNLQIYSEDFNNAVWNKTRCTITNGILAPDGTLSGKKAECNATGSHSSLIDSFNITSGDTVSFSVFIKKGNTQYCSIGLLDSGYVNGYRIIYDLDNKEVSYELVNGSTFTNTSYTIKEYANGWTRLSISMDSTGTTIVRSYIYPVTNGGTTFAATEGQYNYVWGAQGEIGAQVTSYIKTEATTVTELAYQTEAPTEATYTLTRTPNNAKATFEVSELVRDYIEQTLENTSGTTWLEVTLSDSIQLPRHYHFLCTEGYIDNTEGLQTYLNAPSNETFMQSNSTVLIPEGESLQIPINAQYNSFYSFDLTNQLEYSEDFSNAVWSLLAAGTGSSPSVTSNYSLSPKGDLTADRVILDQGAGTSSGDYSIIRQIVSSIGQGVSTVYMKSNTDSNYVISIDETGTGKNVTVTPNWQRFEYSESTNDRLQLSLRGSSNSNYADISVWGAQLEVGTRPTSYVKTESINDSVNYFSNLDSNETQIEYITVQSNSEVLRLHVDSVVTEEITIKEIDCSKFANNKLLFVNKYGAKQEFYVNMKSTEKIRVKDDGFSRNVIDYANLSVTNGLHSYKRRVLESKEMHTLNTPFLDEENVQAFEELLLSEYVWYKKEGGNYIPVIIKDSNMTRKTHLNDKLIQYTIEVESANNLINIQR